MRKHNKPLQNRCIICARSTQNPKCICEYCYAKWNFIDCYDSVQLIIINRGDGVKVKVINTSTMPLPKYQRQGDAGMDLYASESCVLKPDEIKAVATGIYVELPIGHEFQIRSRSGLSLNGIVVNNAPGTIDCNYRGEVKVILKNQTKYNCNVMRGDRIAQMVLAQVEHCEWDLVSKLNDTERGEAGFGSTGV